MFQQPMSGKKNKGKRILFFLFLAALFILIIPLVLMWVWNGVVPDVTHFSPLNYKQALLLFILSRLLFGGFKFGNQGQQRFIDSDKRIEWKQKWQNMSDEERIQFRENWKKRCDDRKN